MATDWTIHIEGYGPTHQGETGDANAHMVQLLRHLKMHGHTFYQARFTADRPEENLLDDATLDLHEQLVEQGLRADAAKIPSDPFEKEPSP